MVKSSSVVMMFRVTVGTVEYLLDIGHVLAIDHTPPTDTAPVLIGTY